MNWKMVVLGLSPLWFPNCASTGEPITPPPLIAHRGASADAPENTLASFRLAVEQRADGFEGDFYLTKDGQIVCLHDETAKRTAGRTLRVADSTLAELRSLEVGSWKGERYRGEKMPTLAEVLAALPDDMLFYLEIKCGPEIAPALKRTLAAEQAPLDRIRIISFNAEVVATVRQHIPELRCYWLTSFKQKKGDPRWRPDREQVLATLRQCQAHGAGVQANLAAVDAEFVQALREGGYEFHAWTADDPAVARRLIALGVDSLTTNQPARLRAALGER